MQTIQVVLDTKLLKAADTAAKRRKVNRSALIRQALQEHLRRLRLMDLEERDRRGYQAQPQRIEEYRPWEEAAAWPEDWTAVMFTFAGLLHRTSSGRFSYSRAAPLLAILRR